MTIQVTSVQTCRGEVSRLLSNPRPLLLAYNRIKLWQSKQPQKRSEQSRQSVLVRTRTSATLRYWKQDRVIRIARLGKLTSSSCAKAYRSVVDRSAYTAHVVGSIPTTPTANSMHIDIFNQLVEKAKTRKNGVYSHKGNFYLVRDGHVDSYCDYFGKLYGVAYGFSVVMPKAKDRFDGRDALKARLKRINAPVA